MNYGDERELLNETLPLIEKLYCWVNGVSFSFAESRRIDTDYARELWHSCTFNIPKLDADNR
jgi:hypothetical protein